MARSSLGFRLAAASCLWVAGTLLVAGVLLVALFRDHIERRFDADAREHLNELVAAAEVSAAGTFELSRTPFDPRFNRPHSGWYWQVQQGRQLLAHSPSLGYDRLAVAPPGVGAGPRTQRLPGPADEPLRAMAQDVTLPEAAHHFTFAVAGPVADVEGDVGEFAAKLALTLTALGVGLLGAVLLQVGFGLRPLRALRRALGEIRAGRAGRLPDGFPMDVQPLVTELNALLGHNAALLERARAEVGNLTHALKNPLTVIVNEAAAIRGERGQALRDQAARMAGALERYRSHARAAGTGNLLGARASVERAVEELRFSMGVLYRARALRVGHTGLDGLHFRGDAQDLEEMLGNLMDNACKWAATRVAVSGERHDDRLRVIVEEDGPGVPEPELAQVLQRGRRLDESVPGSGLGLGITRDIARLYGGSITLGRSPLGGLRAELDLPAAN